jgi:hypothetical protein
MMGGPEPRLAFSVASPISVPPPPLAMSVARLSVLALSFAKGDEQLKLRNGADKLRPRTGQMSYFVTFSGAGAKTFLA